MSYRNNQDVRIDEAVIPDGVGGYNVVPGYLRGIPAISRLEAEPGTFRFLKEEAIKMIPATFSPWARMEMEMSIRAYDMRLNCAAQRTYRRGIDARLTANQRPNFLSVHVLRCIYYQHNTAVVKRLTEKGYAWMLEINVICDATGQRIRRPGSSSMSWITIDRPDTPIREHVVEQHERERLVYTIQPNGDITVTQSWIPGHHPATEDEMLACDDRREQNAMGDVILEGPLRSPKPSPTRRHRAADSRTTALPPPAFVIDLTARVKPEVEASQPYVDLTFDDAAQVPPAAQTTTSRMENAIFVTKIIRPGAVGCANSLVERLSGYVYAYRRGAEGAHAPGMLPFMH